MSRRIVALASLSGKAGDQHGAVAVTVGGDDDPVLPEPVESDGVRLAVRRHAGQRLVVVGRDGGRRVEPGEDAGAQDRLAAAQRAQRAGRLAGHE